MFDNSTLQKLSENMIMAEKITYPLWKRLSINLEEATMTEGNFIEGVLENDFRKIKKYTKQ